MNVYLILIRQLFFKIKPDIKNNLNLDYRHMSLPIAKTKITYIHGKIQRKVVS